MLTTTDIDNFVAKYPNVRSNYCGTYAVDELDTFKKCDKLTKNINAKRLPSCIFNTDPIFLPGTHWMTLLKLQDTQSFVLFDSFGAKGFQEFLIDNRADIVEKFFPNAYTYTNAGDLLYNSKIDMQALVFRADKFLSLTKAQLGKLTPTMQCLGLFFAYFAADKNLDRLNIYVVIDELQDINTDICGIFALHFLHSIYYPQDNDSCNTSSCTISTIKNILNESFHEGSVSGSNLNTLIIKQFQKRYMK